MKRLKKIIKYTVIGCFGVAFASAFTLALLLEPRIPVRGFAELDITRITITESSLVFTDKDGKKINSDGLDRRSAVTLESLPSYVPAAFIAIEDKRFYSHRGIDPYRMIGAATRNIIAGSFKEGASTITQQLVKNTHLKTDKTLSRKIQEIRIARDLERKANKEQILEAYLGMLYFGNNAYGIDGAARTYFGKNAKDLSLSETAALAGIINSPAVYDPVTHPERCKTRRNLVLNKMCECGFIDETERDKAKAEDLVISEADITQNQFLNACIAELCKNTGLDRDELITKKLTVKTAYDSTLQTKIEKIVASYKTSCGGAISVVILDGNGKFVSYVSTAKNDVSFEKRQPASTLKPLLCYAPALERSIVYPCTPVLDEPASFGNWSPKNYNDKYYGWTDVENSLVKSLNIPAVKLLDAVGIENAKSICSRSGIEFSANDNSLALALGSMENGVSLPALCEAYSVFRDGGTHKTPHFVTEVSDNNNRQIYTAYPCNHRVLSPETCYLITDMLSNCAARGTARQVGYAGKNIAAKTGTAGTKDGNTDAYCIAYSPKYTVAVRINATDKLLPNNVAGGTTPAKICKEIFRLIGDKSNFDVPNGIVKASIDLNELNKNKKILLAGDGIAPENRKQVLFSRYNMPHVYSTPETFTDRRTELDDFYNFEIIDRFFD